MCVSMRYRSVVCYIKWKDADMTVQWDTLDEVSYLDEFLYISAGRNHFSHVFGISHKDLQIVGVQKRILNKWNKNDIKYFNMDKW